ncbi:EAL domain-containing protein [Thermomonas sp. HDW16]|uniref:EAL domain-containing protein n=1 Tax=Thermomonas sp. HDW16 TaxID=2714945 RepID=UPI00140BD6DA|nr:EAL domain-containing protein [Thermomonas sp. HDW16]QIL20870.1 EAL domain-containing protein [Thermomonas sp. HDW16]
MNVRPPPGTLDPTAPSVTLDANALDRQLAQAMRDASLPDETRALLRKLADELDATRAAVGAERMRYRALFDAVPDPVSVLARDGTVLDLNKAGMTAYKRPREEVVGKNIDVLNPDLPRDHMVPVLDALDRGDSYVIEVTNMRADGTRFPVEVHSASLLFDGREALVAVARDLSQRQEAEIRYRELMEVIDKGIVIQDRDGRFVYGNSAAMRILGIETGESLVEAMQPNHWIYRHENGRELAGHELPTARARDSGRIVESAVLGMHHRKDGKLTWITITVVPQYAAGSDTPTQLLSLFSDITELKQAEETLRVQAQTDALTGLLNRDAILKQLDTRLADPVSNRVALLYVDLDRFKIVNDMLGHSAGDDLLVAAARRMRDAVASEGLIARFGGDEFVIVCPYDDDPHRPERLARRLQYVFGEGFQLDNDEFSVTTSIGIARAPTDGDTAQQLIQNADVAMYDSKRRRRNGWQSFSPELASRQQERLQAETQLRRALDNGEFHLVYQPQVDLRSGRILYAEALVRWHNPQLGEMRPDRFIELAETTGDIIRIGSWVLQEACAQMRRWHEQGLPIHRVAVNVSYRQFSGDNLGDSVRRALADANLPGHALELELTERVLVDDTTDTLEVFDQLRLLGVQLSIDDFGEGYSALNYLRRLPIHALKLSHSFLKGVPGKPSDVAICQAVAGIAQSLGLDMVAEGVETEAQRDFLLRLGVTVGQGFLFAPGLLPGEFAKRVAAQQDGA